MKFNTESRYWGGNCCGSSCYTLDVTGINLRFDKPWDDGEPGREVVTIKTSKGDIYIKLNLDNKYHRVGQNHPMYKDIVPSGPAVRDLSNNRPSISLEGVEHYSCKEIYQGDFSADVGLVIAADNYDEYIITRDTYIRQGYPSQAKVYEDYANLHKDEGLKVRETLTKAGILLYESQPFYNMTHFTRIKPSLTFFVYDKEMKHEV